MDSDRIHIFLDIDGVLATTMQYYTNRKKWHPAYECYRFDEKCVNVFNQIIEKHNPIIILSSDWKERYSIEQMNDIFSWNGINSTISDKTPNLWGILFHSLDELEECRATEISKYISEHDIKNYIIIDDLDLSKWHPNNFVRTPKANEGIKQSGIKDKIFKLLLK